MQTEQYSEMRYTKSETLWSTIFEVASYYRDRVVSLQNNLSRDFWVRAVNLWDRGVIVSFEDKVKYRIFIRVPVYIIYTPPYNKNWNIPISFYIKPLIIIDDVIHYYN